MITEIDAKLLEKIADLTGRPAGAFNIRKDMGCEARQSTEHIAIDPRADGKPGIDIRFQAGTKGETCHIPGITKSLQAKMTAGRGFFCYILQEKRKRKPLHSRA